MAIQKVLKVFVVCPKQDKNKVLEKLQFWGNMELIGINEGHGKDKDLPIEDTVSKLKFIVDFIECFGEKESFWKTLKEGPATVTSRQLEEIENRVDVENDYKKLRRIDKNNKQAGLDIEELNRQIENLEIVKNMDLTRQELYSDRTEIVLTKIDEKHLPQIRKIENLYIELIDDNEEPLVALIYLKEYADKIKRILSQWSFQKIELPDNMTPLNRINGLKKRIGILRSGIDKHISSINRNFFPGIFDYRVLLDVYENRSNLNIESRKTDKTLYMSIISGWIPSSLKNKLGVLLNRDFPSSYLEFYEPDKKDTPPVILKNGTFSKSFEVITDLYGTPAYDWIDPTPYVAPFFALFFGICITDAGYGMIIAGSCIWALVRLKLGNGAKKFITMLMWGGFVSIVTGALTGGWFGNAAANIKIFNSLKIIDPLEKPQYFLYFSILLGYIQVVFGVLLSTVMNFKTHNIKAAVFEEIPWLMILLAIPVYFAGGLFILLGKFLFFAGISMVLFFSGHESKNIFARIGTGLYNLYGGTDYLKDMISYSRLFALGMGTGILAMAINEISKFAVELLGIMGYVIMPVILISGHLIINLLMSTLSAYVHSSRLLYVEFFSKFFKGGGRSFAPLIWKGKSVILIQ